jgi:hypothetical protein
MTYPSFNPGDILFASDQNAVGLWLVKTQTVGTGVTTVTVDDAFSANYNAYKVVYTGGTASTATALGLQLGAAVTGYYGTLVYAGYGGAGAPLAVRDNNAAQFTYIGSTETTNNSLNAEINNPFNTTRTVIYAPYVEGGTGRNSGNYNGFLNNATSYTSFTIFPFAGSITGGTIRVYGYRN